MLHTAIETRAKSPQAFRTISEVAAELDVPQHVLRFWEGRFTQVKPVKRAGGRRYYRPEDVALLRGIQTLLYEEGMTIKGVQKVLRERGGRYVVAVGRGQAAPHGRAAERAADFEALTIAPVIPVARTPAVGRKARATGAKAAPACDGLLGEGLLGDGRLSEEHRARLEIRLIELQDLKSRLQEARASAA
jgi:DNA-binding transcriptional MerR regulator